MNKQRVDSAQSGVVRTLVHLLTFLRRAVVWGGWTGRVRGRLTSAATLFLTWDMQLMFNFVFTCTATGCWKLEVRMECGTP